MSEIRLSKYLSSQGYCSRREADQYIAEGLVTVDGEVVREAWFRVLQHHRVELADRARKAQASRATILLNKPLGYVSAQAEHGQKNAAVLIRPENYFGRDRPPKLNRKQGFAPAGRLDVNSTGLLVLTQDGRIARQLIGGEIEIEKEYLVRYRGQLSETQAQGLRHGLELDGKPLKPARVQRLNRDQFRITLTEGRKRQIRRMCELLEIDLVALKRVRIGRIRLADLPTGKWRLLTSGEVF